MAKDPVGTATMIDYQSIAEETAPSFFSSSASTTTPAGTTKTTAAVAGVDHGGGRAWWACFLAAVCCGDGGCWRCTQQYSPRAHPVLWLWINILCCLVSFLLLLELQVFEKGPIDALEYGLPLYAAYSFASCAFWCVESGLELVWYCCNLYGVVPTQRLSRTTTTTTVPAATATMMTSDDDPSRPNHQRLPQQQEQQRTCYFYLELVVHVLSMIAAVYFLVATLQFWQTLQTVASDEIKESKWDVFLNFVLYLLAALYMWWEQRRTKDNHHSDDYVDDDDATEMYQSYQIV